jgi:hypothetical protein
LVLLLAEVCGGSFGVAGDAACRVFLHGGNGVLLRGLGMMVEESLSPSRARSEACGLGLVGES